MLPKDIWGFGKNSSTSIPTKNIKIETETEKRGN
jgi:hypothetical protein